MRLRLALRRPRTPVYAQERSEVSVVDEKEFDATEALGATPEELAARVAETEQGEA